MSKFHGVPYTVETDYKITPRPVVNSSRPIIAMQVMSRSNYATGFNVVSSEQMFLNYFPDVDRHITLEKAKTLLDSGFNLYINNAYVSDSPITARIINNEDRTEIITTAFNDNYTENEGVFNLKNYTDSVIYINLENVGPKDYFIIELNNEEVGVQTNMIVWFHDKTQEEIDNYVDEFGNVGENAFMQNYLNIALDQIYYSIGTGINITTAGAFPRVLSLLTKSPLGFFAFYGEDSSKIYLVHNKGFLNIGNHTEGISINMDSSYIPLVLSKIKISQRVLEIKSRYNTDITDIALKIIKIKDYVYKVSVCKLYNNQILFSDTYLGATSSTVAYKENLPMLENLLNENVYIIVNSYQNNYVLPEGTLYLKKLNNENDEIYQNKLHDSEIDMFISGLSNLNPNDDLKYDFYYDSNFNSYKYQLALYNLMNPYNCFGFFTYRGIGITENPTKIAYFSDQEFFINDKKYNTSDACLSMIALNTLIGGEIKNAYDCTDTLFKLDNINYINPDSVLTQKDLRGYDEQGNVRDLRYCMIKPIFLRQLNGVWDFSITSVLDAIQKTKKIFQQVFTVDIDLRMQSATSSPDTGVNIYVVFTVPGVNDFESIQLNLTLS